MPGWDNTARRGHHAYVFHGANPISFARYMRKAQAVERGRDGRGLIFVNAWNEWAEGAAMEGFAAPLGPVDEADFESNSDVYEPAAAGADRVVEEASR
jgi:hypothetical protein